MTPNAIPVIIVMGHTGSGKAEFINQFIPNGQRKLVTGGGMASVTHEAESVTVPVTTLNGVVMVELVDTPDLSDTSIPDALVFMRIATYLHQRANHNVSGIIFLRSMVETNVAVTEKDLFKLFVGEDKLNNVVLLTSFWDGDYGEKMTREAELRRDYWGEMEAKGATYTRFSLADVSPVKEALLNLLLKPGIVPDVVEQLAQGKTFKETNMGEEANKELERLKAEIIASRNQLEERKQTLGAAEMTMRKALDDQKRQFDETIESITTKQREMGRQDARRGPDSGKWHAIVSYQNVQLDDSYRKGRPYWLFRDWEARCFVEFPTPASGDLNLTLHHCCTTANGVIDISVNGRVLNSQYKDAPKESFGFQQFLMPRSFLFPSGCQNQLTIKLSAGSPGVYWLSDVGMTY